MIIQRSEQKFNALNFLSEAELALFTTGRSKK